MKRRIPLFLLLVLLALVACRGDDAGQVAVPTAGPTTAAPPATAAPTRRPTAAPTSTPEALAVTVDAALDLDNYPLDAPFVLHFSEPMGTESSASPLLITPVVRGDFAWSADGTTLTFTPNRLLSPHRNYRFTLRPSVSSVAGRSFEEPVSWEMTTLTAPRVVRHAPAWHANDRVQPTIRVRFSRAMDADSVAANLSVTPTLPLALSWDGLDLVIATQEPLAFGAKYDFTIGGGATDRDGVPLYEDYGFVYRLQEVVAGVKGPTRDKPDGPVRISFNYAMDRASVEEAAVFEPALTGVWAWDDDGREASLTPAARLPADATFNLSFSGPLRSSGGATLPAPSPFSFTTPPTILTATPSGAGVRPASLITVRFDRPMDHDATGAALTITPTIAGEISWGEALLNFRPESGYFEEQTTYTVTIGTAARGAEGEPILDTPYTWTFTTGMRDDLASFGWGPNAQVLDVNGRRAIHFQGNTDDEATLEFSLYRLSLTQFLDRYASGFRGAAGWDQPTLPPISTEGTELVTRWRAQSSAFGPQETFLPADVLPGLYILNLTAGHLNDQLIVVLTENTLAVKQAERELVTWVSDINGAPRAGVPVAVYARNGSELASGNADANGVFRTTLPAFEAGGPPGVEPLIVVARAGNDVTVSGLAPEWRNGGSWWGWWGPTPAALDYAAYVFTDRPIYKPGQTVYFKAIVRNDDDAILSLVPAGTPLQVRLRDARDNVVQTLELAVNDFGSVDGSFLLADGAMLGTYHVELVVDGETHRQALKVEDYRKPDYEVTVTVDAPAYVDGDTVTVGVEARYFFGDPVADAELTLHQFRVSQNYDWTGQPGDSIWYDVGETPISGRTDASGRFTTTVTVHNDERSDWLGSFVGRQTALEARVRDGSNQEVSGSAVFPVYNAAERLDVDTGGYVHAPGDPFTVRVAVSDYLGNPVAGRDLSVEASRWQLSSYDFTDVVQEATAVSDESGAARVDFDIPEAGYYQLRVRARDEAGRDVSYTTWVFVYSDLASGWYGRGDALRIDADRDSYAPGDTARLLIESDFSGPALLTWERGTTRREELIELTAPLTSLEVPVRADDVPNVYVTVTAWQAQDTALNQEMGTSIADSRLHVAHVNLSVPAADKVLTVTINPDADVYAPRDEATVTVRVTNVRGEPVSAEVSLAMVDEAIYALSEELVGPIYEGFYFERDHIVRTYDSMSPTRFLWGGGMGGGGDGGLPPGGPRSDFPDTAAWFPALRTDSNGEATVTMTLPDSLTTWRLTARAATADTQVGEATAEVLTQQAIVLTPLLPRNLTVGDTVQLSALLHNRSGAEQTLSVGLAEPETDLLRVQAPLTQTVTLAAGERRVVGWQGQALQAGTAALVITALPESEDIYGDAVALSLPVQPLAVRDVTTQVGQFRGSTTLTIDAPADALPLSSVEVQLSRSIAGNLLHGLDYLTGFPYGCVEQTMSKALPNAVVGRAFNQLGINDPTLAADLPARINASLQRLYGYQHNDGGWGWWYDDPSHDYQTAWVVFGLALTADAGYEVDAGVIERGIAWLQERLSQMDPRTRAFALYSMALAGDGDGEAALALVGDEELDVFSQAALALALHRQGEEAAAADIVAALAESATVEDGVAYWDEGEYDGYYYEKTMASTTRATALALSALSAIDPGSSLEGQVVRYLMAQRRQEGWGTTNETAFAIVGLTDHLVAATAAGADAASGYEVRLNGAPVAAGEFRPGAQATTVSIPYEQLRPGANELTLVQQGSGSLYYVATGRFFVARNSIDASGVVEVSRTYRDPERRVTVESVAPGQLVEVRLQVTLPQDGSYLIVEDRLPGGLEALNERLNTTSHVALPYDEEPASTWREYGYNHKEVHGDRVTFFITEMEAGTRTLTYYARATSAGSFTALPAEAYAMYNLSLWGRSASDTMTVSVAE